MEPISGGILGALLGGGLRLAPEILKWLDRKNERQHELSMFKESAALERVKGDNRLSEIQGERQQQIDVGVVGAFKSVIDQQTEMVKAAGAGWVASLSATVRPVITYWLLAIWSFVHIATALVAFNQGFPALQVFGMIMTADFTALVAGTFNYWFLDRTLSKRGLS